MLAKVLQCTGTRLYLPIPTTKSYLAKSVSAEIENPRLS